MASYDKVLDPSSLHKAWGPPAVLANSLPVPIRVQEYLRTVLDGVLLAFRGVAPYQCMSNPRGVNDECLQVDTFRQLLTGP